MNREYEDVIDYIRNEDIIPEIQVEIDFLTRNSISIMNGCREIARSLDIPYQDLSEILTRYCPKRNFGIAVHESMTWISVRLSTSEYQQEVSWYSSGNSSELGGWTVSV